METTEILASVALPRVTLVLASVLAPARAAVAVVRLRLGAASGVLDGLALDAKEALENGSTPCVPLVVDFALPLPTVRLASGESGRLAPVASADHASEVSALVAPTVPMACQDEEPAAEEEGDKAAVALSCDTIVDAEPSAGLIVVSARVCVAVASPIALLFGSVTTTDTVAAPDG